MAVPLAAQISYAAEAETYEWDALETLIEFGSYITFIWIAYWAGVWITAGFRS